MNRGLVVLTTIATILGTAIAAGAQTALASDESPFRFQFEQRESPRGLAVEGYVYNASAGGWVLRDVPAGGRGYFSVPCRRTRPHIARAFRDSTK